MAGEDGAVIAAVLSKITDKKDVNKALLSYEVSGLGFSHSAIPFELWLTSDLLFSSVFARLAPTGLSSRLASPATTSTFPMDRSRLLATR